MPAFIWPASVIPFVSSVMIGSRWFAPPGYFFATSCKPLSVVDTCFTFASKSLIDWVTDVKFLFTVASPVNGPFATIADVAPSIALIASACASLKASLSASRMSPSSAGVITRKVVFADTFPSAVYAVTTYSPVAEVSAKVVANSPRPSSGAFSFAVPLPAGFFTSMAICLPAAVGPSGTDVPNSRTVPPGTM